MSDSALRAFVLAPIVRSEHTHHCLDQALVDAIFRPALTANGYLVVASNEISQPLMITHSVIRHLLNDDLVVANLTGPNPIVMYGLAIRHAARLPIITYAEEGTELPFSPTSIPTLIYRNCYSGTKALTSEFARVLQTISTENSTNPIGILVSDANENATQEMDIVESHLSHLCRSASTQAFDPSSEQLIASKSCFRCEGCPVAIAEFGKDVLLADAGVFAVSSSAQDDVGRTVTFCATVHGIPTEEMLRRFAEKHGVKVLIK